MPSAVPSTTNASNTLSAGQIDNFLLKFDKYPAAQKVRLWIKENTQQLRPWSDFLDRNRFSKPTGTAQAMQRINHNVIYFKTNYACIAFAVLLYSLITNLWLLFAVAFLLFSLIWISSQPADSTIQFSGQSLTQRQLYIVLLVFSVPLLWISAAGSTIFWVIGITGVIVVGHAAVMEKSIEEEFA